MKWRRNKSLLEDRYSVLSSSFCVLVIYLPVHMFGENEFESLGI